MKLPLKLSRSRSSSPPSSTLPSPAGGSTPSPTSSQKKLLPSAFRNIPFPSLGKNPSSPKVDNSSSESVESPPPSTRAESQKNGSFSRTPSFNLGRGKGKATVESSSSPAPPTKLQRVPSMLMREIKQVFAQFDANGDGKISADELREVLRSLGEETSREEAVLMVDEVDADGDGFIDLQEFVELNTRCLQVTGEMASQEELTAAFAIFDLDKNGRITAEELAAVLSRLGGKHCSLEDCRRMIRGVDRKGLGHVDFDDFKRMMMSPTAFLGA